jgi:type II secretory pathway component PulF
MAFGVALFLVLYIIPSLSEDFRSTGAELPALTAGMMALSDFALNNLLAIFATIAGLALILWLYLRTETVKRTSIFSCCGYPCTWYGPDIQYADLFLMASMLLKSGLKLPQVLYYAGSTVGTVS